MQSYSKNPFVYKALRRLQTLTTNCSSVVFTFYMTTNKFPFVVNLCSHSFKPSLLSINPKSPILQRQSGRKYPIFYPSQKKKQALPRPASCLYLCLFFYCNLLINVRNVAILESLILLGFKHFFRGICLLFVFVFVFVFVVFIGFENARYSVATSHRTGSSSRALSCH